MTHISEIYPLTELLEAAEQFSGFEPQTKWFAMRLFASSQNIDLGMLAHLLALYEGQSNEFIY